MNDDPLRWEPHDRHWIRLRGPWSVEWVGPPIADQAGGAVSAGRVTLPAEWSALFGRNAGTARFTRKFQKPTNLEPDERVVITLCEVRCDVRTWLNDSPFVALDSPFGDPDSAPCADSLSFDVTDSLGTSNQLVLELTVSAKTLAAGPCGLWRPVLLECIMPD